MDDAAFRRLESTVMELGTEIFVIKNQLNRTSEQNEKLLKIIHSLQKVLDEKDVVSHEDLEVALKVHDITLPDSFDRERAEDALDDPKKFSH
jgi:regulator of replication initiation timing